MISDKLYNSVFKSASQRAEDLHKEVEETVGPETKSSLINRYVMQKEAALMQEFDKKLREEMGLPTYGKAKIYPMSGHQIVTDTNLMNPIRSIYDASRIMTALIMKNALTKDKIDNLTLEEYQGMCKKIFRNNAEIPSQEALNNFKTFAKKLAITDPMFMAYLVKTPPDMPYNIKNYEVIARDAVISEVCKDISDGREKPERLKNFAEQRAKAVTRGMNMSGFLAGKITTAILTVGMSAISEVVHNITNREKFKDLPKRDFLHPKEQVAELLNNFEQSMSEFMTSEKLEEKEFNEKESNNIDNDKTHEVEKQMQENGAKEENELSENIKEQDELINPRNFVETRFASIEEMKLAIEQGVPDGSFASYDTLTIYSPASDEFDNIDKENTQINDSHEQITLNQKEEIR